MQDATTFVFYLIALVIAGKLLCRLLIASALGIKAFRDRIRE